MKEIHYPKPRQRAQLTRSLLKDDDLQSILTQQEQIIVINIQDLIQDDWTGHQFSSTLEELIKWRPKTEVKRLLRWLDFINKFHSYEPRNYNRLANSIIWAFEKNRLINSQTQAQFEISVAYLKLVLQSNIRIESASRSNALIVILLLLGNRPELQVRSFKNHFEKYMWYDNDNAFFKHLFIKRPTLSFLVTHLEDLDNQHLDILMALINGVKLADVLPENLSLSKLENKILHQYSFTIVNAENHFVERYIIAARLIAISPKDYGYVLNVLDDSKIFREQLATFADDISFWKTVIRFITTHKAQFLRETDFRAIVDYLEFKRYYDEEPFTYTLKGRTPSSVLRNIEHWHFNLSFNDASDLEIKWNGCNIEPWLKVGKEESYIIEEITDGRRLFKESKALHHCAFSYMHSCKYGALNLFTLSKIIEEKKVPFYTIELRDLRVAQIGGQCNCSPTKEVNAIIKEWASDRRLNF